MPRKTPIISSQEAELRLLLGIGSTWEKLDDQKRHALRHAYSQIILDSFIVLCRYDATLTDIFRGMARISSINPFCGDISSKNLKAEAMDEADSLLREYGLPSPLPASGNNLRKLRDEWPAIRSQRRRRIRKQKCIELSLPLNSSWESIKQHEQLAEDRKRNFENDRREGKRRYLDEAMKRHVYASKHGPADPSLLSSLIDGIRGMESAKGYVYLKQWRMGDGTTWYKIGITGNPQRRENEQNVLPVPAETIALVELASMGQARNAEKTFLEKLQHLKIRGAGNRELFHLDSGQLCALMHAFEHLRLK